MTKERTVRTASPVETERPRDPDRQSTLLQKKVFQRIQEIQNRQSGPMKFDHGALSTAAINIVLDMEDAENQIMARAIALFAGGASTKQ